MALGKEFTKGIFKENPVLVFLLGLCPVLAVSTSAFNGLGMGVSATFVLLGSNVVVSLLAPIIPRNVRIPSHRFPLLILPFDLHDCRTTRR